MSVITSKIANKTPNVGRNRGLSSIRIIMRKKEVFSSAFFTMASLDNRLYEFAGRYRIALKKDQPISNQDKPLLSELVNKCIPHIPDHLHADIFTSTCCFAVLKAKDQSFTLHIAFTQRDLIIKFKIEAPHKGSCSFYKLEQSNISEKLIISNVKDQLGPEAEEWYIVSSKERDGLLMPPPPPRPPCEPNKTQRKM